MNTKSDQKSIARKLLSSGARIAAGVIVVLVIGFIILYFIQNKMIYFPQRISLVAADEITRTNKNARALTIHTSDNITLHGWLVKNSGEDKAPLIIYFGGNAEEVSYLVEESSLVTGWDWALINYRGYGLSQGSPSEQNLFNDALSVYDYFSNLSGIDASRIVLFGRSLGTGVAVYLAGQRKVGAVILASPYDSLLSVAKRSFPFLPVGILLRQRYDSLSRAAEIKVPLLALVASNDEIIPPEHSRRLVKEWGGPTTLAAINGAGHNTISYSRSYWDSINEFLGRLR